MCNECCKAFRSWCGAFTKIEILLCLVQALLMILFVTVLTVFILHLTACYESRANDVPTEQSLNTDPNVPSAIVTTVGSITETNIDSITDTIIASITEDIYKVSSECTWTPSHKTEPVMRYYDVSIDRITSAGYDQEKTSVSVGSDYDYEKPLQSVQWDGIEADDLTRGYLMALVKMKRSSDIMFGCTLTIISDFWTVTAASCIESIEEVDTLDSFVMMEGFGEKTGGRIHTVSDVMIHPEYQGSNTSYDVCALRSEDKLTIGKVILELPTMLDNFLTTIGERLSILGYGKYRSIQSDPLSRGVRVVSVHILPWERCAGEGQDSLWAVRHLEGGVAVGDARAPSVTRDVCAGTAGSGACRYCAGTPLLRSRVLVALMADWRQCGVTCAPAPFVSLAPHAPWLRSLDTAI